jgi:outer membrane protein assembly factor BamB
MSHIAGSREQKWVLMHPISMNRWREQGTRAKEKFGPRRIPINHWEESQRAVPLCYGANPRVRTQGLPANNGKTTAARRPQHGKDLMSKKWNNKLARVLTRGNCSGLEGQVKISPGCRHRPKAGVPVRGGAFWAVIAAVGLLLTGTPGLSGPLRLNREFNERGNILIADQFNNRTIEISPSGNIVWSFGLGPNDFSARSIIGVNDVQRVGPFTLMAGTGTPAGVVPQAPGGAPDNRVLLVDPFGKIVWQYGQFGQTGSGPNLLNTPVQCTWLPDTHVLITDQANNRIIEVNLRKQIVWQYPGSNTNVDDQLNGPNSAELLENGRILIADQGNNRAIEVTRGDQIVRTFSAGGTVNTVAFASRLEDGHTLLTDAGNSRAVEVDANDMVVWQYATDTDPLSVAAPLPTRAVRLRNGDTLISDQFNNRVIRVNHAGVIVASYGLPLAGGPVDPFPFGNNVGYDLQTTRKGLYSPYDAKVVGDYTGLTPPFDFDRDGDE